MQVRLGDVVLIEEDVIPQYRWKLNLVICLIERDNGLVRGAEVKVDKTGNIQHPINPLNPAEAHAEVNKYEYSKMKNKL